MEPERVPLTDDRDLWKTCLGSMLVWQSVEGPPSRYLRFNSGAEFKIYHILGMLEPDWNQHQRPPNKDQKTLNRRILAGLGLSHYKCHAFIFLIRLCFHKMLKCTSKRYRQLFLPTCCAETLGESRLPMVSFWRIFGMLCALNSWTLLRAQIWWYEAPRAIPGIVRWTLWCMSSSWALACRWTRRWNIGGSFGALRCRW